MRARGVAWRALVTCPLRWLLLLTSPLFEGLFLSDANLVMSRPGISEKSLKRVSSISGVVASGLKSVMSVSMLTSYWFSCDFRLLWLLSRSASSMNLFAATVRPSLSRSSAPWREGVCDGDGLFDEEGGRSKAALREGARGVASTSKSEGTEERAEDCEGDRFLRGRLLVDEPGASS